MSAELGVTVARACAIVTAVSALAIATLAIAAPGAAQSRIDIRTETIARVIASGGIGGRFARPICRRGRTLAPLDTALYTYALEREVLAPDQPMIVDTGGLLAPHGVARYAAETDPEALAELVHALGYRAIALGLGELGAPRESMIDVLRGLRDRRIPTLATNVRCEGEAAPLCDVIVDASDGPSMHTVAGRTMAVLAFLPTDATSSVAPDRAAGVSIEPIADALPRAVRRARERGASIVVAIVAIEGAAALTLAQGLPHDGRPDLILLAGAGDLLFARPATVVPAIASPPRGDAIEVLVREGLLRAGYEMVAQPLGNRGIDVGTPVHELVWRVGGAYCEAWGSTLPGGTLERSLEPRGLAELAARIVQLETDADVAVVNMSAIDSHWRPAREDALTESDLYVALEHDEPLLVAEVPSTWITELARRAEAEGLITPGLTWDGSSARVLERPLQSRARYRVVTIRFLASGGDQALPPLPDGIAWRPIEQGTLRSVVLDSLRERTHDDARDALTDPRIAPEWVVQGTLDGTFSGSSVENPAGYDSSPLNRGSTLALGLEVNLRADATAPTWSWENTGVLRYRAQWLPSTMPGTSGAFTEAVDQIQVRSLGAWRGLRQRASDWFVPDPFVEVFFESELTEPDARAWHWMLLRPMIGTRFPLTSELEVKLFTGFQAQLLQPESEAEFGIGSTITLRPWDLARIEDRHVTVQAVIDYFLVDLGDENRWQLRGSFDGSFDLAGPLALTLGVRAYVQQDRGQQVGIAVDATAGFRLGWLGRAVGP